MVFDAHDRAFAFYKGACTRGIYDNMKTAVDAVFVGKERACNRRFQQMCSHYLVDPVACTPASGWEKGQVENQVGTMRERLFSPRVRVKSMAELNDWLLDQCVARAKVQPHPEIGGKTIWEVFEAERASLVPYRGPFAPEARPCLRTFGATASTPCRRRCRRPASCASTTTSTRSRPAPSAARWRCAPPFVSLGPTGSSCARTDASSASMPAPSAGAGPSTTRGTTSRCWPASRGPCATAPRSSYSGAAGGHRAGARAALRAAPDGDKRMVEILGALLTDGLPAVEAACAEALSEGVHSADVILDILARSRDPGPPVTIMTPEALRLTCAPVADCNRHDSLRRAI